MTGFSEDWVIVTYLSHLPSPRRVRGDYLEMGLTNSWSTLWSWGLRRHSGRWQSQRLGFPFWRRCLWALHAPWCQQLRAILFQSLLDLFSHCIQDQSNFGAFLSWNGLTDTTIYQINLKLDHEQTLLLSWFVDVDVEGENSWLPQAETQWRALIWSEKC